MNCVSEYVAMCSNRWLITMGSTIYMLTVSRREKDSNCHAGEAKSLPGPDGFISSHIKQETGEGSITCPLRVEAAPGQHINITLFNFLMHYGGVGKRNYGYARFVRIATDYEKCVTQN